MSDYLSITKEELDKAYNNHLPSKWIVFGYKYFSKYSEKKTFSLKNILVYILLIFFAIGFIGTIFDLPRNFILIPTLIYTFLVFLWVGYMFSVIISNNKRIKLIAKELGINVYEYNMLIKKYYVE